MSGDRDIIGLNKVSKNNVLPHQSEEGNGHFPLETFYEVICLVTPCSWGRPIQEGVREENGKRQMKRGRE